MPSLIKVTRSPGVLSHSPFMFMDQNWQKLKALSVYIFSKLKRVPPTNSKGQKGLVYRFFEYCKNKTENKNKKMPTNKQ